MGVVKNLMVRVGADLSGLVSGIGKASNAVGSFKKEFKKAMKESGASMSALNGLGSVSGYAAHIKNLQKANREAAINAQQTREKLVQMEATYSKIQSLTSGIDISTPISEQLKKATEKFVKLTDVVGETRAKLKEFRASDYSKSDRADKISSMQDKLTALWKEGKAAQDELAELEQIAASIGEKNLGYASAEGMKHLQSEIRKARTELNAAESAALETGSALRTMGVDVPLGQMLKAEASNLKAAVGSIPDAFREAGADSSEGIKRIGRSIKAIPVNILHSVTKGVERISQGIRNLPNVPGKIVSGIKAIGTAAARTAKNGLSNWLRSLRNSSIRSSGGIDRLTQSLKRIGVVAVGVKLAGAVLGNFRSLVTGYISQNETLQAKVDELKAGFGQALAPAINLATNALSKMTPYILGVSNAIGELITNLFGTGWTTVAEGAAAAASATGIATDAQNEYNRTLAGFDKITKLSSSKDDGSAGSSTAAAKVTLPSWLTDLPQTLKDAFSTDGFKGVGETLSTALSEGLQQANKSDGSLGKTVAKVIQGAIDGAAGFVENLDYEELGTSIDTFFSDLFGGIDWGTLSSTIGSAVGGIGTTIWTAISDDITATRDYFDDEIEAAGGNVILGIWNGITKAVENVGTWIKDNIFTPFVDGFKKTFNIHSPSKAEEIVSLGSNIIAGIYNGIVDKLKSVGTWIEDNVFTPVVEAFENVFGKEGFFANLLKGTMKDSGNLSVDFKANLTSWKDKLTDKAVSFKANLTSWKDKLTDKAVSFKANLASWKDKLTDKAVSFKANLTSWNDKLTDKAVSFKAKMTTWTDSLSNKLLEFKVNLTQGWTGSLAKLLGIESIASKLELKLPKITIKWQTKNTILGDISLPTGFDVKWNAKGAILNGAQIFGMAGNTFLGGGEAGREAVLPLDRNTGWMDKIADRVVSKISTGGAGDQSLVIYLTLDGKVVTKTVIKNINAQAKATGKNPLAAYI